MKNAIALLYSLINFATVDHIYKQATEPVAKYIQIQLWQTCFIPLGIKLYKKKYIHNLATLA